MSENGNSGGGDVSAAKKPRVDLEAVEEKDFDEETQKALEEIDATQNEIDSLNERKRKLPSNFLTFFSFERQHFIVTWHLSRF